MLHHYALVTKRNKTVSDIDSRREAQSDPFLGIHLSVPLLIYILGKRIMKASVFKTY